ncbi:VanZ family protein, partial [Clostridiaceae bacterium HSG29]|nr:VanZ family protein [Clostridiaceae bacterium HSG29]
MILWIIIIYYFSSQNAVNSSNQSLGVLAFIENLFSIKIEHGLLRECAHFFNYAVLGILAYKSLEGKLLIIVLFGISISISDETFQGFIDGRSSSLFDVIVDSFGFISAILFSKLFLKKEGIYETE